MRDVMLVVFADPPLLHPCVCPVLVQVGANIHTVFCPIWRLLFRLLHVDQQLPGVDGAFLCRFPHY